MIKHISLLIAFITAAFVVAGYLIEANGGIHRYQPFALVEVFNSDFEPYISKSYNRNYRKTDFPANKVIFIQHWEHAGTSTGNAILVNGNISIESPGRNKVVHAIEQSLNRKPKAAIESRLCRNEESNEFEVSFELMGFEQTDEVVVAILEQDKTFDKQGILNEKCLNHYQVEIDFHHKNVTKPEIIKMPENENGSGLILVSYIRNKTTGEVKAINRQKILKT
jgi:hypothetical protein